LNPFSHHLPYYSLLAHIPEIEPNDLPEQATYSFNGDNQIGTFNSGDTVDYWRFDLIYPSFVNIYLTNIPSGSDYDLSLYKSTDLSTPIWSGLRAGNTDELGINISLQSGKYYLKIIPFKNPRSDSSYLMRYRINKHWPVIWNTKLSRGFTSTHKGIDILPTSFTKQTDSGCLYPDYNKPCYSANKVVSAFSGSVSLTNNDPLNSSGYGRVVYINSLLDGKWIQTRYAHLWSFSVSPGSVVTAGQQIGWMGNTGLTTGTTGVHTHFETRECPISGCTNSNSSSIAVDPKGYFPGY